MNDSTKNDLIKIKDQLERIEQERDVIGEKLKEIFQPMLKIHLANNEFERARESLRPMPSTPEKVIMFSDIIRVEERYIKNNS